MRELEAVLRRLGRIAVALSGGLDSMVLLTAAVRTLGADNVLSLTALAPNFPQWEAAEARACAAAAGCEAVFVEFDPFAVPEFAANSPQRCYWCKKALLGMLLDAAHGRGFDIVCDGGNVSDVGDYRPGMRAVQELGVVSPLLDAGMGKPEIRALARELGVQVKPSFACLASRIPYGQTITREKLARVEAAELYVRSLGIVNVRVRDHDGLARIEVDPGDRQKFFDQDVLDRCNARLRELGFAYAALDLGGYAMGSLNRSIARP